jgi:hypothetical protein
MEWLLVALKSPVVEPPEGSAYWGAAEIVRGGAEPPPMTQSRPRRVLNQHVLNDHRITIRSPHQRATKPTSGIRFQTLWQF